MAETYKFRSHTILIATFITNYKSVFGIDFLERLSADYNLMCDDIGCQDRI